MYKMKLPLNKPYILICHINKPTSNHAEREKVISKMGIK